ncbi:MAG: hypothetical protein OEY86_11530 [Nitrospira sp.]|nr:hypothetical protein [Nitrospira sp.]
MTEIQIDQLRKIANKLFDHIENDLGIEKFVLDKNFYWDMDSKQLYDVETTPTLNMGSLYDDWEFVSSLLEKDSAPVSLSLTELAPLLRYLGEKIGQ